jgi:hypothetical protein
MRQPRLSDLLHMSSDEWHRNIQQWQEERAAMATENRTTIAYANGKPDAPLTEAPYRDSRMVREGVIDAMRTPAKGTVRDWSGSPLSTPTEATIDVTISTHVYAKYVIVRWLTGDSWRVSVDVAVEMTCGGKELEPVTQQISATVPRAEVGAAVQKILDTLGG